MWIPTPGSKAISLQPLAPSEIGDEGTWLQPLLFDHPEVLPVGALDPGFGPPVSLAREVPVGGGPVDLIVASPRGNIALIETKLWRNAQARREVVVQAIDYAKELQSWTFDIFDARIRSGMGCPEGVLARLRSAAPHEALDEEDLRDAIEYNLASGKLLILIVGDRIRPEAEALARWAERHLTLRWTLGLVELEVYRSGQDGATLVVPSVVERIVEERRLVVTVEGAGAGEIKADLVSGGVEIESEAEEGFVELDEHAAQYCIDRLRANGDLNIRPRLQEYEDFVTRFAARARELQSEIVAAGFRSGKAEAIIRLEIRGRRLGRGRQIVKCACWQIPKDGGGLLWGFRGLSQWAEGHPTRTEQVELLRDRICQLIVPQQERQEFEAKVTEGRGDLWTYFPWFTADGLNQVLDAITEFCRAIG